MSIVLHLVRREIGAYLVSPLAYVILAAFLFLTGTFFSFGLTHTTNSNYMGQSLDLMGFVSLVLAPMITMRLVAEEKRTGAIEMLVTAPVTETQVVLAKYFAAVCFYLLLLVPTGVYVYLLARNGNPDYGPIVSGYAGLVLLAGVFLAVGLLVSAMCRNQITAAVVTFVVLLMIWVAGAFAEQAPRSYRPVVEYLGLFGHFDAFRKGLIDTRDIVYYVSWIVVCLFLTVRVLETRRWK